MKVFNFMAAAVATAVLTSGLLGCATSQPSANTAQTPTYVLVHGAFQDARAWDDVLPLLKAKSVNAVAVNLPGRAASGADVSGATLDSYRDAVLAVVKVQPGPVVLVGHSFGGITISNVAEAAPEKIKTLVYVAGYLPQADTPDQSMAKLAAKDQWNKFNKERENFIVAKDYKTASVLADDQVMLFCEACSYVARTRTLVLMQREPLTPAASAAVLSAARYGKVDKVYIHTTQDKAVSYPMQQAMVKNTSVRKVMTLQTGHSPYLEAPQALADALTSLN
jgi:pimeloyl-ACP methyl ester carboxylesterase